MSWKETNPMELWRNSTTLPVPSTMVISDQSPEDKFANHQGTMRNRLWQSLSELSMDQRKLFFESLIYVWPYPLERYAIKQSRQALVCASAFSSAYIAGRISTDVFLLDQRIGLLSGLKKCPTRMPVYMCAMSSLLTSTFLLDNTVYAPFVESEANMELWQLGKRVAGIALLNGVLSPCLLAPVAANYHNYRLLEKMGKPPVSNDAVLDLVTTCWESMRSVWRRLPALIGLNLAVAGAVVAAMGWGRERLHATMDLDPELVRTLMADAKQRYEAKTTVKLSARLQDAYASTLGRVNKEIKFGSPLQSDTGPKWNDDEEYGTPTKSTLGVSLPPLR